LAHPFQQGRLLDMAKLTREQKAYRRAVRTERRMAKQQRRERRDRIRYEYDGIGRLFDSLELRNEEFA
jgi:hypothetical protein